MITVLTQGNNCTQGFVLFMQQDFSFHHLTGLTFSEEFQTRHYDMMVTSSNAPPQLYYLASALYLEQDSSFQSHGLERSFS